MVISWVRVGLSGRLVLAGGFELIASQRDGLRWSYLVDIQRRTRVLETEHRW